MEAKYSAIARHLESLGGTRMLGNYKNSLHSHLPDCLLQMLVVLVDKLIRMQIVECSAVVNWLLSRKMAPEFMRWVMDPTYDFSCLSWASLFFCLCFWLTFCGVHVTFPTRCRFYVWEIMTGTLKKMSKHTKKVRDKATLLTSFEREEKQLRQQQQFILSFEKKLSKGNLQMHGLFWFI